MKFIDDKRWDEVVKKPDWYIEILAELPEIKKEMEKGGRPAIDQFKEELYGFFEKHLAAGTVALGNEIGNWDTERKPVDTIVLHHTKNPPGMTSERLSAMELIRLYAPYYANPEPVNASIKGLAISSGHVRDGKQVFNPYHWVIRVDGTAERQLLDTETGWQAGNWDINCRSVAIVLDNDYANSRPSVVELNAIAQLIKENYADVSKDRILGHCEVNLKKTHCPSELFLSKDGTLGWKEDLLDIL